MIVCTRNRAASLERCLQALESDTSSLAREIIVVDNASDDHTSTVARAHGVRYEYEPKLGHSHARNAGVAAAHGEVLLFTDDDVEVCPGWTDALAWGLIGRDTYGAAGGRVIPRWEVEPPAWMAGPHAEALTLKDYGHEPRELEDEFPVGANMAVRAELARRFRFHPRLGHTGIYVGGEEWWLMEQIRSAGYRIAYQPAASVVHHISESRMSWEAVRQAWFGGGFGLGRIDRLRNKQPPDFSRRIVRAARTYRHALRLRIRNRTRERTAEAAWEEFWAYAWAGKHLEDLLGNHPRLSDWAASHLAR